MGENSMAMKKFKMLNLICESCTLTSKEKLVAQYFIYKSNKKGECYPSVETIANHCGVSERTVQRATKKLQEKYYISIEIRYYKGRQSSNEYRLNTMLIDEMGEECNECGASKGIALDMEIINLEDVLLQSELVMEKADQCESEEIEVKKIVQDDFCEEFDYDDLDMGIVNFAYNLSGEEIIKDQKSLLGISIEAIVGLNIKAFYLLRLVLIIKKYMAIGNFEKIYFIDRLRYRDIAFKHNDIIIYFVINNVIFKIEKFIFLLGVSW